jgi:clan AA aspartic protease (TIGR02281 family)
LLTSEDARRIGIDPSMLSFDKEIKTASGAERAAVIRLGRIQAGFILIDDVPAKITAGNTSGNVLGRVSLIA